MCFSSNVICVSRLISIESFLFQSTCNVESGTWEMWKDLVDTALCAESFGNDFSHHFFILTPDLIVLQSLVQYATTHCFKTCVCVLKRTCYPLICYWFISWCLNNFLLIIITLYCTKNRMHLCFENTKRFGNIQTGFTWPGSQLISHEVILKGLQSIYIAPKWFDINIFMYHLNEKPCSHASVSLYFVY